MGGKQLFLEVIKSLVRHQIRQFGEVNLHRFENMLRRLAAETAYHEECKKEGTEPLLYETIEMKQAKARKSGFDGHDRSSTAELAMGAEPTDRGTQSFGPAITGSHNSAAFGKQTTMMGKQSTMAGKQTTMGTMASAMSIFGDRSTMSGQFSEAAKSGLPPQEKVRAYNNFV